MISYVSEVYADLESRISVHFLSYKTLCIKETAIVIFSINARSSRGGGVGRLLKI